MISNVVVDSQIGHVIVVSGCEQPLIPEKNEPR